MRSRKPNRPDRDRFAPVATLVVLALVAAACASSAPVSAPPTTVVDARPAPRVCTRGASLPVVTARPVPGVASDRSITSFDGTVIRAHWFPRFGASATHRAPTVLLGSGWSLAGETLGQSAVAFGSLGVAELNRAGYNVLTWDSRGFGASTGQAALNDPKREARDVQVLIDWVAGQPEAQLDRPADPHVGMAGFSTGGGVQLVVAGLDCRVDVIMPGLAWHSLETSLFKADTVKAGWAGVLTSLADPVKLNPHIVSAAASAQTDGVVSQEDREWFAARGPGELVAGINVPTLFVQGTVDTLFTLDEAVTNFRTLHDRGVPTAMLWFCGGHGTCLTSTDDGTRVRRGMLAWLDRYLRGDADTQVGPALDLVDQDGVRWTSATYPSGFDQPVTASARGGMPLTARSSSGPPAAPGGPPDVLRSMVLPITPATADHAVRVHIDPGRRDVLALGAPQLHITYQGTSPPSPRPTRIFAQLVDDRTGAVLGNQVTPIAVVLDGKTHSADVPLEVIAHHLRPGQRLTLQIVATTVAYATPALGGKITFHSIAIALPTAAGVRRESRGP